MTFPGAIGRGLRSVWETGVTPDVRPEDAKHIRWLNFGMSIFIFSNLLWTTNSLTDENVPAVIILIQLLSTALVLPFYLIQRRGLYNAARIYGFSLYYAYICFSSLAVGEEVLDHFFIFMGIGGTFLVCPRTEKRLLVGMVAGGVLAYLAILVLYDHVPPVIEMNASSIARQNQIILYELFVLFILLMMFARFSMSKTEESLQEERKRLADMASVLKKMFGRYLSVEVMNSIIEDPSSLELGGEKRRVTIMMTDLRGFTAISERLQPEQVIMMLNSYFEIMIDIILKYNGTINEIIGDSLLVVFGAPQDMPDRTERAVACAIEMQNAMVRVNRENQSGNMPFLAMGIGLNETEVVVGNVGSSKRSKYGVVGSGVNMTSRIESYSVGGQILVSESIYEELDRILCLKGKNEVFPKGAERPLRIYEVAGIAGRHNLALEQLEEETDALSRWIPVRWAVLGGKKVKGQGRPGRVRRLSRTRAEVTLDGPVDTLADLKLNLTEVEDDLRDKDFYGKVVSRSAHDSGAYVVHFTAVPPEISAYFQACRQHSALAVSPGHQPE